MKKYFTKENYPEKSKEKFEFVQMGDIKDERFKTEPIGFWKDSLNRFVRNKASVIAFFNISVIIIMAIIGPWMNEYEYNMQNVALINMPPRIPGLERLGIANGSLSLPNRRLANLDNPEIFPPGSIISVSNHRVIMNVDMVDVIVNDYIMRGVPDRYHWFGTDFLGRDIWTRLWRSARTSLLMAFLATAINVSIGLLYGSIAGYYGGASDMVMMRFAELLESIPSLIVMIMIIMFFGISVMTLILAFILTGWIGTAWTIRAQFFRYKNREYVLAARTLGVKDRKLIFRHILPNGIGPIVTRAMIMVPGVMFGEAFLSYLGLGLRPPDTSIGVMLADGQRTLLTLPHQVLFPAVLISILMISFNLFANGLREALDPTRRGEI
ncbi:MAG: ABC transporter permease [Treponema sp.]|nr:ABC transporter permease [Treponema sp.]